MDLSTPADVTTPQFPNTDRTRSVFAVAVTCIICSLIAVGMRLLARVVKHIKLAPDDYLIFVALLCTVCFGVMTIKEVLVGGVGRHADTIFPGRLVMLAKMLIGCQIFFAVSLGCIKVSICLFYTRVFETKTFRMLAFGVMGFCAAWCLAAFLVPLLLCQPIAANWDPSAGKCGNQNAAFISIAVIDILTDLLIMALPVPMVLKLQMPWATRIGLIIMFSAGILTMIISALRVYNLARVDYADPSWTTTDSFIWSIIEPTVALMIACAPMCRSLVSAVLGTNSRAHPSGSSAAGLPSAAATATDRKTFSRMRDTDIALAEIGGARVLHRSARASAQLRTHASDSSDSIDYPGAIKVRTDVTVEERPRRDF